jgi:hypothetical protein
MACMYATNYPINLLLCMPEIYRRVIRMEITQICFMLLTEIGDTRGRSSLRHYATSRKVAGSIPD